MVAQGGVVSRGQLLTGRVTERVIDRLIGEDFLRVITPGIYARVEPVTFVARCWAGILLGGQSAVIGGEAAGFLHRLIRDEPAQITVHSSRRLRDRPGWRFTRAPRTGRGEPPRTEFAVATLDLCEQRDEDGVAAILADALSSRKTSAEHMRAALDRRPRLRNGRLLRDALGDVAGGAHSALERRYLTLVERAHELPVATRQTWAHRDHRSDAWYEDYGLLVELDSKLHHSGGAAFRDMTRDNDHAIIGIVTLRYGWKHVTGIAACETARQVGQFLSSRGWEGVLSPCTHCRLVPTSK